MESVGNATAGANAGSGDGTPCESSDTLAASAGALSRRLGVSVRHIRRMHSAQKLPRPVRLGRSVRWPAGEIADWLRAGAPDRERWERVRTARDVRARQ
jgi:predicted DNA-binding transcriptional regulator AlpA